MVQLAQWGKQQRWAGPLRGVLAVVLLAALAYVLASTFWLLWQGPVEPISTQELTQLRSADGPGGASSARLTQQQVERWQLFGEYQQEPKADQDQPTDAPDTRLRLVLLGVFQTTNKEKGTAIIAEKGQDGELYHIGDSIPGNASLEEVYADRVILRRAGRLETLRWSEAALGGVQAVASDSRNDQESEDEDSSGGKNLVRQRKLILRQLGLEPVAKGQSRGYTLGSRAPKKLLARVGLKPDDVIISVNGHGLGTKNNDLAALRSYEQTQQATIVVERGNQQFTVNYPP